MNLAAQLPLTAAERKIAPAARTILIGVETYIRGQFDTLKTPAAITSFWGSLNAYAQRNHTASGTNGAPATRTPARKPASIAKGGKAKTRGAGAA